MSKFNTGNAVPSANVKDLYDNAENLDDAINGAAPSWLDRKGQVRKSWTGLENDFRKFLADGSTLEFPTWEAASAAAAGGQIPLNRQVAVIGDPGTHLDSVTGLMVPNSGRFVMEALGLGWRSRDVLSQKQDAHGLSEIFDSPNLYRDSGYRHLLRAEPGAGFKPVDGTGTYTKGAGASLVSAVADDGRAAVSFKVSSATAAFCRWSHSLVALGIESGATVSASLIVVGGSVVGHVRVMFQQFDSVGHELVAGRRVVTYTAGSIGGAHAEFPSVALETDAASVGIYVDGNSVGTEIQFTDLLFARGMVAKYRPPIDGYVLSKAQTQEIAEEAIGSSLKDASENPNLLAGSAFDFSDLVPLASGAAEVAEFQAQLCWKITDPASGSPEESVGIGRFPVSKFRGKVSAAVLILGVEEDLPGSGARVLLRQFNGSSEITAARQTVQLGSGGSAVGETLVSFNGVSIDPVATSVELYIAVQAGPAGVRSLYFRDVVVRSGESSAWVAPAASGAIPVGPRRVAHVGPAGSDKSSGTLAAPFATLQAAIEALGGDGTIFMLEGAYGPNQAIVPTAVTGVINVVGLRQSLAAFGYQWPVIRLANKLAGITKTPGRAKVYQASASGLPSLGAFQWAYQDGVADPRTAIAAGDRSPEHRGRSNRLDICSRLLKTAATELNDALAEMDAADMPMAFVDGGTLYFTIVDGGDGTTAAIYLDAPTGLIANAAQGSAGMLNLRGLDVRYGGVNLAPFQRSRVDELRVTGARTNVVSYNVLDFGTLEVSCGGSQSALNGDGLNGHTGAVITAGTNLYSHDNWDDGFSDHEGCSTRMSGGLVEYNGGGGITPAYGADTVIQNFVSRRNQQRGGFKRAAFYVTGSVASGAGGGDGGVDTNALFIGCTDIESRISFASDSTASTPSAQGTCIGCRSIRPEVMGFAVTRAIDCSYLASDTSESRHSATLVEVTSALA
ncbi:hypothetical protein D3C81_353570 [compost metagenome]